MPSHLWRRISEEQLARMVAQGGYMGAGAALQRARIIRKGGRHPAIFHNRLDGFMVLDEDDPAQRKRVVELRLGPKPPSRR
ncbi:MAG: hypothetical protein A3G81_21880 [Betaproteobacteria bacterium RIFCSPLOWO2_12_FULL_65_14]|nr:MAG: hypothetical protein A3G81_21880 [Betaproteobacteria bacterium RIFCSPLOWO2_12_FULL_65_14]